MFDGWQPFFFGALILGALAFAIHHAEKNIERKTKIRTELLRNECSVTHKDGWVRYWRCPDGTVVGVRY